MRISDVVRSKGTEVVTIPGSASVRELLALLQEHNIGAVVVVADDGAMVGIVSERDIVRKLHASPEDLLASAVSSVMTRQVHTCALQDDVEELAGSMTERHIRHIPVLTDGALVAIVSIGDIVKSRLHQLQAERDQLEGYINS